MYVFNKSHSALLQEPVHQDEERYGHETWSTVIAGAKEGTIGHGHFVLAEKIYINQMNRFKVHIIIN